MKIFFDLFPVLLFFVAIKLWDVYVATAVAMVTVSLQVVFMWVRHRKVDPMLWMVFAVIVVLGGATLLLHDNRFIMWKPTVVYWGFAVAFLASRHFFGRRTLLERTLGEQFTLPGAIWARLNITWVIFFAALGLLNLFVAFYYAPDLPEKERMETWAAFKVFGASTLTLIFAFVQALYIVRHAQPGEQPEE